MIQRHLWTSYITPMAAISLNQQLSIRHALIRERMQSHAVGTAAIFQHQQQLYGYLESNQPLDTHALWLPLIGDLVQQVPTTQGMRITIDLPDIYHDGQPHEGTPWRAPGYTPTKQIGSLARLKPEMYCSYVYYHYLRQEDQPHGFNKYYIIGAHEYTIFSYQEWPATVDDPKPRGSMQSNLTPTNWQELMHEHFELWPNQPVESQEWIRLTKVWGL